MRWTRLLSKRSCSAESLGINSKTNNRQGDRVLPSNITNEHLKYKETKVATSTSKKQNKTNWGWYSSFFTLTSHVAWIIKLKANWIKKKTGAPIRESFSFLTATGSAGHSFYN